MENTFNQNMPAGKIILYQTADGRASIDVKLDNETVWLTKEQMALLFERDRSVISRHIRNIFQEGELDEKVVCAKNAHTTLHGALSGKTLPQYITAGLSSMEKRGIILSESSLAN